MVIPFRLAHLLLAMLGFWSATSASAQTGNLSFLSNSPVTSLSHADIASLTDTIQHVRDTVKDGEHVQWFAPHRGTPIVARLTPSTAQSSTQVCRIIKTELETKGQSMTFRPTYCKLANGEWQLQKQ